MKRTAFRTDVRTGARARAGIGVQKGRGLAAALAFLLTGACGETRAPVNDPHGDDLRGDEAGYRRVISLDYCADQYVLRLLPRARILSLSPDAEEPFSYMRTSAAGVRKTRPRAEDVLVLKPDLVVRAHGGGPAAAAFFRKAGVPVLQLGYANDLDGVRNVLSAAASGLGASARGAEVIAQFDARRAVLQERLQSMDRQKSALYMTPGGYTTGPGSLIHEVLRAAGYANFQSAPGWRPLPLERLAYERPDVVAAAFFNTGGLSGDAWTAARHPLARRVMKDTETVRLRGASMACGAWFVLDAVETLAGALGEPSVDGAHDGLEVEK